MCVVIVELRQFGMGAAFRHLAQVEMGCLPQSTVGRKQSLIDPFLLPKI